jgi:hypothetical protein
MLFLPLDTLFFLGYQSVNPVFFVSFPFQVLSHDTVCFAFLYDKDILTGGVFLIVVHDQVIRLLLYDLIAFLHTLHLAVPNPKAGESLHSRLEDLLP